MKTMKMTWITAVVLLAGLAIPVRLIAQDHPEAQAQTGSHPRFIVKDVGTFTDGQSRATLTTYAQIVNSRGMFVGQEDTSIPDPYYPNFSGFIFPISDPLVQHGFVWNNGLLTDLGALPNGQGSGALWINEKGEIAGVSENGLIDPLLGTPEVRAVVWRGGQIVDLGTLGGNESLANSINDYGQIAGFAANTILDPFSLAGFGTQTRAVLWENGVARELGTLGGNNSLAFAVNNRGQVIGMSYTNSIPNSTTGIPTTDPFLWENGKMVDLGSLGGTFGAPNFINQIGQIVGQMNLAGDLSGHPFLWDRGSLKDLGTLGGDNGEANWVNDSGEVVGGADYPGGALHHAFLWKQGVMKDLGVVADDKCSSAFSINSKGQIVGDSGMCGVQVHAFLWENGTMIDLNTLIPPGVQLFVAYYINDLGEIACEGYVPGEEHSIHDFLLIPAQEGTAADQSAVTEQGPGSTKQPVLRKPHDHRAPSRGPIQ